MEKIIEQIKSYFGFSETQIEYIPLINDILGVIVPKTKRELLDPPCAILLNSNLRTDAECQQRVWSECGEPLVDNLQKLDCNPLTVSLVYIIMLIDYGHGHVEPDLIHIVDIASMHSTDGRHILNNIVNTYKGIIQHKDENEITNGDEATGNKPRNLWINISDMRNIPVNSWIRVLEEVLYFVVADKGVEIFVERYPKFINSDPKRLRRSRKIGNCYFEANLSAKQIYNFCVEVMEFDGMSNGTYWKVFS